MLCRSLFSIRHALFSLRTLAQLTPEVPENESIEIIDTRDIVTEENINAKLDRTSVLDECQEDISHIAPYLKPTFNFAAYANKSETIQKFINLGVDLHKLEEKPDVLPYILGLDFEKDVQKHLLLLSDIGVPPEKLGPFISKNPYIFKEDLENLSVRINYLKSKRFNDQMISRIVSKNPFWLLFSTERIDKRLGFFQKHFALHGNEVRSLTTHLPKIITYRIKHIKLNTFVLKEEMGFTPDETKQILLKRPDIFIKSQDRSLQAFEFVHKTMGIPLERIVEYPGILTCRLFKLRQRHLFLKQMDKAQYDAKLPNYVSLRALIAGTDAEFCSEVAKSSIQAFNMYLKSE